MCWARCVRTSQQVAGKGLCAQVLCSPTSGAWYVPGTVNETGRRFVPDVKWPLFTRLALKTSEGAPVLSGSLAELAWSLNGGSVRAARTMLPARRPRRRILQPGSDESPLPGMTHHTRTSWCPELQLKTPAFPKQTGT